MLLASSLAFNFVGFFLYISSAPAVLYGLLEFNANQFGYLFIPAVSGIVVGAAALFCATQIVYAGNGDLAVALTATLLGGAGIVACEVVAETALARVVPPSALGRVMGVYDALSVAAMVLGAMLAPILITRTSLRTSLAILVLATLLITFLFLARLRGLDTLSHQRAEVLASRLAVIERLFHPLFVPSLAPISKPHHQALTAPQNALRGFY